MNWKTRFFLLVVVSIPAFTGYPVNALDFSVIPGVTWGWLGYFLTANTLILLVLGPSHFSNTVSVSALVTLPVVFVGATVSYLLFLTGFGHPDGPAAYSAHYVSLCLTMLTVIPLALSLVAVIPFHEVEQRLLSNRKGVSGFEKSQLMFLRVFNHIIYFVIPNILEVMREENRFRIGPDHADDRSRKTGIYKGPGPRSSRMRALIRAMTRFGIEGICAAVQYIPLWAVEISRLPDRKGK